MPDPNSEKSKEMPLIDLVDWAPSKLKAVTLKGAALSSSIYGREEILFWEGYLLIPLKGRRAMSSSLGGREKGSGWI
jgi:hypothetical protein